jgi:hypothetical protein
MGNSRHTMMVEKCPHLTARTLHTWQFLSGIIIPLTKTKFFLEIF